MALHGKKGPNWIFRCISCRAPNDLVFHEDQAVDIRFFHRDCYFDVGHGGLLSNAVQRSFEILAEEYRRKPAKCSPLVAAAPALAPFHPKQKDKMSKVHS
jgi:hypothetical protein